MDSSLAWKVFNYKQYSEDRRKLSRKRHSLNVLNSEVYPAEGHCWCHIKLDNCHTIYTMTGCRFTEDMTWNTSSAVVIYNLETHSDIELKSVYIIGETDGASLSALYASTLVEVPSTRGIHELLLFGGLDHSFYKPVNSLYHLTVSRRTAAAKPRIRAKVHVAQRISGIDHLPIQQGDTPVGRYGHSMTKIQDSVNGYPQYLLIGGTTMDKREHVVNCADKMMEMSCSDKYAYTLTFSGTAATWKKMYVGELLQRTFHSAAVYDNSKVLVCGGLSNLNTDPERIPANKVLMLSVEGDHINLTVLYCATESPLCLSCHSTHVLENKLYVYGGFGNHTRAASKSYPNVSSSLMIMDLGTGGCNVTTFNSTFASAGCTMAYLGGHMFILMGGTAKAINVLSTHVFDADPCAHTNCIITQSAIVPVPWIQCDYCLLWYHQYCLNLKKVPAGKYKCPVCHKPRKAKGTTK